MRQDDNAIHASANDRAKLALVEADIRRWSPRRGDGWFVSDDVEAFENDLRRSLGLEQGL